MGDALTDIARDNARGRAYGSYIDALITYLQEPSEELLETVIECAEETDSIHGGYWGSGNTNLASSARERIQRLVEGDRLEWAKLLFTEKKDDDYEFQDFHQLLELSPFSEASIIAADHGASFVTVSGNFLPRLLARNGYEKRSCKNFVIVVPDAVLEQLEVHWVNPKPESEDQTRGGY